MAGRSNLAFILLAPLLLGAQAPAQPPQQQATPVEGLVSNAPAPIPKIGPGAAMFTPDQLKEYAAKELSFARCNQPAGAPLNRAMHNRALEAQQATLAADKARQDMGAGLVGQEVVDRAELARQAAVRAYLGEIKAEELPKFLMDIPNVTVLEVDGEFLVEGEQTVFVLSGMIRNDKQRAVDIPHLSVTLMDPAGYVLFDKAIQPEVRRIQPGETKEIAFRLPGAPAGASDFRIAYAPRDSFNIVGRCGLSPRRQLMGWYAREVMAFENESRSEGLKVVRQR